MLTTLTQMEEKKFKPKFNILLYLIPKVSSKCVTVLTVTLLSY